MRNFSRFLWVIFLFGYVSVHSQIFLNADSTGDAYSRISSKYYGYEVPDCVHPVIHITEPWDSFLKEYVFSFNMHKSIDNDRCINFDRQRIEIKTWDGSPDSLLCYTGETLVDRWKFKLDAGFQPSANFSHIHQIKAGDGTGDNTDNPIMTITARYKSSGNRIELIYTAPSELGQATSYLTTASISGFLGNWVEAYETLQFGDPGHYSLVIKRVKDDSVLVNYTCDTLSLSRAGVTFCRPKYGLYRSLLDSTRLRDESILFADFSLKKGTGQNVPANPTSLHSTAVKPTQAPLAWSDNSSDEALFRIDRSTNGTTYSFLGYTQAGVTAFTDTGLIPSTTYYYRVRAENQLGNSGNATVTYTTSSGIPNAPTGLTSNSISANRVILSWTDNSSDENLFRVERSLNGSTYTSIGTTVPNVVSYTDSGLAASTLYYYRVRAENQYGNSAYTTYSVTTSVTEPTVQTSGMQFTAVNDGSETIAYTPGNGTKRLLLMHAGSAVNADPSDNTTYTASTVYGSGTQVGTGNYVIYADTGRSLTITGLTAGVQYFVKAYEFNGGSGSENYLTTSPASGSFSIAIVEPSTQASNVVISSITTSAMTITCAKGSGSRRIFVMRSSASTSAAPSDSVKYTANSVFGSGNTTGSGNYTIYSDTGATVTVTGLSPYTSYAVSIYEYNGINGTENYLTASPATGSATTLFNGISSTATGGTWSTATTWSGGVVPASSDNVLIVSGATVNISGTVSVASTMIAAGGKLNLSAATTLNGNIICNGMITGGAYVLTTNGNLTISGTSAQLGFASSSGKVVQTASKTFTLSNGATFEHYATGATPLSTVMSVSGSGAWTWAVDNSANNTTISYKNSSSTTVITALPSGQSYGNLTVKSPTNSPGSDWTNKLGANLSILGNFTILNTTAKNMGFNLSGYTITGNNSTSTFIFSDTSSVAAASIRIIGGSTGKVITDFAASFPGFVSASYNSMTTGADTIPGGTYANLTLSGTGAKLLNANLTVNSALALSSGKLTLGAYNLVAGGAITGTFSASSMIITSGAGELRRTITSLPVSLSFPVGTVGTYSPVYLTLNSGTISSAYIGVKASAQKNTNNTSTTNYLNRTWTITSNGISNAAYSDTLQYAVGDIAGSESSLYGGLYSSAKWKNLGAVDASNHFITASNLTTFGDFTGGELSAFPTSGFVNVKVVPQGFYNSAGYLNASDTVKILLANASTPYATVDSVSTILDALSFTASAEFKNAASGNYFLIVKHRNSIETWSAAAVSFSQGSTVTYDFTDAQSKAYGNNLVQVSTSPEVWAVYSGDVNQDGYVDPLDLSLVDQDSFNYASGRSVTTDINGDGYVDPLDLSITDQNSFNYVGVQKPVTGKIIKRIR